VNDTSLASRWLTDERPSFVVGPPPQGAVRPPGLVRRRGPSIKLEDVDVRFTAGSCRWHPDFQQPQGSLTARWVHPDADLDSDGRLPASCGHGCHRARREQ
jgi:hypothetical protein